MAGIDLLDVLLTSGLLGTLISLYAKWRHDKKKAPLEREQVLAGVSQQNIDSALAISAEYRQQLETTKASLKADAEDQRRRHEQAMAEMQNRHDLAMTVMQERISGLTTEVAALRADEAVKDQRLATQDGRVTRLEDNLTSARGTVVGLLEYIKAHTNGTTEVPVVDFTIFDH